MWLSDFTLYTPSMVSTYILVCFTIEVCLSIVHPVAHKRYISHRLVTVSVIACWLFSTIYHLGVLIGVSRVVDGLCYIGYEWLKVKLPLSIVIIILKVLLPVSCFIICYVFIIRKLRRLNKVQKANSINPNNDPITRDSEQLSMARTTTSLISSNDSAINNTNDKLSKDRVNTDSNNRPTKNTKINNNNNDKFSKARVNVAIMLFYSVFIHVITWSGNQIVISLSAFDIFVFTTHVIQVY